MPPDDPGDKARHYSEKEVGRLLKRATELQQADEDGGPGGRGGGGMTLATLQEVAAEAGIEPRYIQQAAARIDSPEASGIGPALAGTPLVLRAERVIPGDLREEDCERIVEEIQGITENHGDWTILGRTLTWWDFATSLEVTVVSRDGETQVQGKWRLHSWAGILFGVVVGGVGIGIGTFGLALGMEKLGSVLFATLFPTGLIGTLYVTARQIMKTIGRKRRAKLDGLLDRIAQCVQQMQR